MEYYNQLSVFFEVTISPSLAIWKVHAFLSLETRYHERLSSSRNDLPICTCLEYLSENIASIVGMRFLENDQFRGGCKECILPQGKRENEKENSSLGE